MQNMLSRNRILLLSLICTFAVFIIGSFIKDHGQLSLSLAATMDNRTEITSVRVSVIDVGQGDSILVEFPNKEVMLVDAGDREHGETVVAALRERGVVKIDLLVATHPHADHIGGMVEVINAFPVDMVWSSSYAHGSRTQGELIKLIKTKKITMQTPRAGEIRQFADASLMVMAPAVDINGTDSDANNNCLVLQVNFEKSSILLAADMEEKERDSIKNWSAVTVLKVAHHGSHNGTDAKFLAQLQPKFAAISCAAKNDFGHPHAETLAALAKAGVTYKCTATAGTVVLLLDGISYSLESDAAETITTSNSPATPVIGNRKSKTFHRPECKSLPKRENQVEFSNRADALKAGYKACGRCKP